MSNHNAHPCCCGGCQAVVAKPRRTLFGTLLKAALIYVLLVFIGGTLLNTGRPVPMQIGLVMHAITFVNPAIHHARSRDFDTLADGLELLARGAPLRSLDL